MAGFRLKQETEELFRSRLFLAESEQSCTLNLQQCNLSETDLQYITSKNIEFVIAVKLGKNSLSSQAMRYLSECKWSCLVSLNLPSNKIGSIGCKFLTKGPWKQLTEINLFDNQIEAVGANHLSKGQWKVLELLNLNYNKISGGIGFLLLGGWTSLKRLYLRANYFDYLVLKKILESDFPCLIGLWLSKRKKIKLITWRTMNSGTRWLRGQGRSARTSRS